MAANPEREWLKARLTLQNYRLIKGRGLTQVEAGEILGIKQWLQIVYEMASTSRKLFGGLRVLSPETARTRQSPASTA